MALSRFARIGQQALHAPARGSTIRQPRCWGSARHQVSLSTVLEKADNVLPCYAIIQRQLGAEVAEEPRPSDVKGFAHSITWSWNGKEIAIQGEGRSKRAAKNEAARHVLKQLISEEGDLMDPTSNPMLAQWAIEWLNSRLGASMEMQDETPEEEPDAMGAQDDRVSSQQDATHSCVWSCPQLPGETTVQGTARTVAESRRQLMATLYKELPSSLDAIVRDLPTKTAAPQQQQLPASIGEANLGKTNVMHNEVTQQLAILAKHEFGKTAAGEFECTLTWNFYDEALRSQRNEKVTGVGRNKQVAKGKANQQMLIKQGHLPDLDEDFHRSVGDMKKALDDGRVHEVIPLAKALMERTGDNAASWSFFLPEVMRMVLAENDQHGLSELMSAAQFALNDRGLPIDLWESLLDEASFSMRHYHLAQDALQQLARFPLAQDAFPGELEQQYFTKYRHLLALERHGGLLHGIQQYELDPRSASSVPLVDVHAMESEKVVLTSIPESGVHEVAEGSRALRGSDLVLLVPLEALQDQQGVDSFEDPTSCWQHPGTWLASVSSVKGDPRMGEEVRVHTKRISRFASEAGADGEQPSDLVAPMVPGRQYRLFHIAMETPTARMLSCLRCLTQVQLPAWSDNFEGRKPSYHYSNNMRQILLGTPEASAALAPQAARATRGASNDALPQNLPGVLDSLTPTQRRAVERAMVEQLSLIQGPPGTGKTHVAVAIIMAWAEKYAPMGERILAVADSNVAADNLYTRLEARGVQNIVRVGQGKEVGTMVGDQLWQAVKTANVVIATCIGSGMEMLESRGTAKYFQRVVIDECTQACEPAALVALGRSAEQAVLIGDHNQLPATVLSRAAKNEGLGISLFERMILTNGLASTLLIEQRRMHSSIAAWPNLSFYQSQLVNAVEDSALAPVPGFPWPNPECRVCFVDVKGANEQKRGFSAYNSAEAEAVAEAIQRMTDAGVQAQEVAVLTAYLAQRDEIRRAIGNRQLHHAQANLSIDTVDGYQGMERDIILFSAARNNAERTLGFLADSRRMNVMLTRARRGVIVFGNGDMLRQSMDTGSHWRSWLDWVESQGSVITVDDLMRAQAPASMAFTGTEASFGSTGFGDSHSLGGSGSSQAFAPPSPPPQQKSEWEKVFSEQYGKHYYWNTSTNATTWETPAGL